MVFAMLVLSRANNDRHLQKAAAIIEDVPESLPPDFALIE